jgi:hypothetical protein
MEKTPRVNRGCKSSPVKVTKADGTVEMQPAYDLMQLRRVVGHGKEPPKGPNDVKSPAPSKNGRKNYRNGKR